MIWQELPKPLFILAPMEAVTDNVFRRVVKKAGTPDLFFSEFTNATGWVHAGEKAVAGRLDIHPEEDYPLIAQIWGSIPEDIAKLAIHCKELGYKGIDINMGCPEKSAVKSGGGAGMCQTPDLASAVIAAAKTAGLPVSVKCRLGYSRPEEWQQWLKHLLSQQLAALTVHLRTKKEMSKVPAHWELMPAIKQLKDMVAPQTLLIGNGDVQSRAQAIELIEQTGIDGVMIGRGVFANIFTFEPQQKEHSKQELIELLHYHLNLFEKAHTLESNDVPKNSSKDNADQNNPEHLYDKPYQTLKRFYKIYIRDFEGAAELRAALMETKTIDQARKILQ